MKAIIMAGGEGTRLRPLTCDCPKPMLPLMGKPLMEHTIALLKQHGITEIAATLGYLPDAIMDYFGDGSNFGIHLHYYIEKTPLGTAGSVKQAADFLDERFIVLSGDGVTDFDLDSALDFHQKNDAQATLLLKKCANPQEYGMVVTDADGKIRSFHEKPGICDVFSDRINTGIYILEPELLRRIPENIPCDFGNDLFPALLQADISLYGCTMGGYWCDVGDVPAYLQAHIDAMDGKIHLEGLWDKAGVCTEGASIESGCRLDAPCFVDKGSRIAAGAHIGPYTVIGQNCVICSGADVKRSVLYNHVQVDTAAQLRACIIGKNGCIGEASQLYEGSVVGSRSSIGAHATLPPGVKLWPDKHLPNGERPENNVVWGQCRKQRFIGGSIELENPVQTTRAIQACISVLKPREILLGRASCAAAGAPWHAAAAGAMAQGVRLIDAGTCTLPQLRHSLRILHADAAVFVDAQRMIPLEASGAFLSEKKQREILKLCERQDFSSHTGSISHPVESANQSDMAYIAHAASAFRANPLLVPTVVLYTQNSHLLHLAEQAFERAGLRVRCEWDARNMHPNHGEVGVYLSDDGQQASFADPDGRMDEAQRQLLIAWTALQKGEKRLILHNSASRAIDLLATDYGAQAVYLADEYTLWMQNLAESSTLQFDLQFDGIYSALACLSILTGNELSLTQWKALTPRVFRKNVSLRAPASEWGRLLRAVVEESEHAELGGGVRLWKEQGWAWLSPDESLSGLNIMAEAMSMEVAEGMCDGLEKRMKQLLSH